MTDFTNENQGLQPQPNMNARYQKPESRTRKFWRVVFGSALGFILASIVIPIVCLIFLISMVDTKPSVPSGSVLELTLDGSIVERTDNNSDFTFLNGYGKSTGLDDILNTLKKAQKDDHIKGLSLYLTSVSASPATLTAIRNAVIDFEKSGKFVYAYSDNYSQGAYYIASAAKQVYLNPKGNIDLRGMASQIMFYKGLIDKLELEVEVVKCGKFKSAVEPYIMDKMSEANRTQMETLLSSIWGTLCQEMAESRHLPVDSLNQYADQLKLVTAENVLAAKLVDKLIYRSEYYQILRKAAGTGEKDKLSLVCLSDYLSTLDTDLKLSKDKIAVLYAYGEIIDGVGNTSTIGSESLCKEIRKAYKDDKVKAIVLRVNSPGGSALASEVIWNEIEQAKAAGKKVVVSMGDYAASGGYYISSGADYIFTEPTTLTGSIGVFGMLPNVGKFLQNKLGITIDGVSTNAHSDAFLGYRQMSEQERAYMQSSVDDTYKTFLLRVATGRKMEVAQVDSIGQGRVWSGKDAIRIGLADKIGNMEDAILYAAKLAGVKDYSVVYYPAKKNIWEELLDNDKGSQQVEVAMREQLGEFYPAYDALRHIRRLEGIQARLPMEIIIK